VSVLSAARASQTSDALIRIVRPAFVTGAIVWAVAIVAATWIASQPHPASVAYAAAFVVYGLAAWICHQRPERSFYMFGTQMPVCARCAGIYFGAAGGAIAWALRPSRSPLLTRRARVILIAAAAPTAATLMFEWTTGIMPSNGVRALAGAAVGVATAWIVNQAEVN